MPKTTILLVRHGQSEGNVAAVFTGHSGYPLSALGHEQAARTGEYVKNTYLVDAVYSSDLPRAFQTAEYVARAFRLPIITDCRLREIQAGDWENLPFAQLPDLFPEAFGVWMHDIGKACCTNGESVVETAERFYGALLEIAQTNVGKCIVVASHATPIGTALQMASGKSVSNVTSISWGGNCAISELEYTDGKLILVRENYIDHLIGLVTKLPENV